MVPLICAYTVVPIASAAQCAWSRKLVRSPGWSPYWAAIWSGAGRDVRHTNRWRSGNTFVVFGVSDVASLVKGPYVILLELLGYVVCLYHVIAEREGE